MKRKYYLKSNRKQVREQAKELTAESMVTLVQYRAP